MTGGDPADRDAPAAPVTQSAEAGRSAFVVQAGRDVNLRTGAPVTTRYRHQVKRIAPSVLLDRDAELAELGAFCAGSSGDGYQWWRAEAWAGKTALLSRFVLDPPPGVRVVSFFVTARLAGQADRPAFVTNVLEQLLTLLGEEKPQFLDPATSEAHLLGLLEEAAALCRARGEHLALVVDGLDEDRSVTTRPDSHSIAALLPAHPPEGLRIVVAGRPDPPVPADVPEDHPLRRGGNARSLTVSEHARALRAEMERDLRSLLAGAEVERELLGLVAAAGGGLTAGDLAELAGTGVWRVRDHLRTVSGRSFTRRDSDLDPGADPEVYLLAHEELQVTAVDMLGAAELTAYRRRLHDWADGYRERGWPPGTPEYLLRGYHPVLLTTADLGRATALATDPARHERLFHRTGGDTTALDQVTATLDAHAGGDVPDLVAVGRLAVHRDFLTDRNTHIPPGVPALWVRLGRPHRATGLARSITDPHRRVLALASLAEALVDAGDHDRVDDLLDEAADTARSITDFHRREPASAAVGVALAKGGHHDRAAGIARSIADHDRRNAVVAATAVALAATGEHDRATAAARSITDSYRRGPVLASVAERVAAVDPHRARELLREAERTTRAIIDHYLRSLALARVALSSARSGHRDRADVLFREASRAARSSAGAGRHDSALAAVAEQLARAGYHDRATAAAHVIADPDLRIPLLVAVAGELATAGHHERAEELLREVEGDLRSITDPGRRGAVLTSMAEAVLGGGQQDRARDLLDQALRTVRSVTSPRLDNRALAAVAEVLARSGHHDQAAELIDRELETDRGITDRLAVTLSIVTALAGIGRVEEAAGLLNEAQVRYSTDFSFTPELTLLPFAVAWIRIGHHDRAVAMAKSMSHHHRESALRSIANELAEVGEHDRALELARSLATPGFRSEVMASVARALTRAGDRDRARELLDQALELLPRQDGRWVSAPEAVVRALAEFGDHDRVLELARAAGLHHHPGALPLVVRALAAAGDHKRVNFLIARLMAASSTSSVFTSALLALAGFLSGDHDLADKTIDSIADVDDRCRVLVRLARELVEGAAPEPAARFAARALRITHWSTAVDDLCAVSMPAALAVVADFLALSRS
ncbi:hypothetical protein [Saccharothrix lopnurensis]|uniref:Tetratricopeptide repeat protein n=1 Tax=Saccharothrix lopnurensis TaxID=1670621 RepID=A0ABW1NWA3_9PSEU